MAKEKRMSWESIGIIIAILVLAASILFAGIRIPSMVNTSVQDLRSKIEEEIKTDLRREVISFMYAFRSSSVANRQISAEDVEKGYQFAQDLLSKMK